HNCELLSKEYKGVKYKLKYKCVCNKIAYIRFSDFQNGHRCRNCFSIKSSERMSGDKHPNYNPNRDIVKINKKISNTIRDILKRGLEEINQNKTSNTESMLGYTRKELLHHLQKDPLF